MSLPSHFIDEMVVIKDADLKKNDHQSGEKVIFSSNQAPKRPPDPPPHSQWEVSNSKIQ